MKQNPLKKSNKQRKTHLKAGLWPTEDTITTQRLGLLSPSIFKIANRCFSATLLVKKPTQMPCLLQGVNTWTESKQGKVWFAHQWVTISIIPTQSLPLSLGASSLCPPNGCLVQRLSSSPACPAGLRLFWGFPDFQCTGKRAALLLQHLRTLYWTPYTGNSNSTLGDAPYSCS